MFRIFELGRRMLSKRGNLGQCSTWRVHNRHLFIDTGISRYEKLGCYSADELVEPLPSTSRSFGDDQYFMGQVSLS